jgi:hypothetical protein
VLRHRYDITLLCFGAIPASESPWPTRCQYTPEQMLARWERRLQPGATACNSPANASQP